jgi:hypothetical protein
MSWKAMTPHGHPIKTGDYYTCHRAAIRWNDENRDSVGCAYVLSVGGVQVVLRKQPTGEPG